MEKPINWQYGSTFMEKATHQLKATKAWLELEPEKRSLAKCLVQEIIKALNNEIDINEVFCNCLEIEELKRLETQVLSINSEYPALAERWISLIEEAFRGESTIYWTIRICHIENSFFIKIGEVPINIDQLLPMIEEWEEISGVEDEEWYNYSPSYSPLNKVEIEDGTTPYHWIAIGLSIYDCTAWINAGGFNPVRCKEVKDATYDLGDTFYCLTEQEAIALGLPPEAISKSLAQLYSAGEISLEDIGKFLVSTDDFYCAKELINSIIGNPNSVTHARKIADRECFAIALAMKSKKFIFPTDAEWWITNDQDIDVALRTLSS